MKKVFRVFAGALAALLLSSASVAATSSPVGKDGYRFEKQTIDSSQFLVTIVKLNSYKEVNQLWKEKGGEEPPKDKEVKAFSFWSPDGTTCTIYMVDPKIDYEPQYYGHELTHCMYGWFHE